MKLNKDGLKPCPFCGNPDVWLSKCLSAVQCRKCFCKSPLISKYVAQGMSEEEATRTAWNTRYGES